MRKRMSDFRKKIRCISWTPACFSVWSRRTVAKRAAARAKQQEVQRQEAQIKALLAERDALLENSIVYQEKLTDAEKTIAREKLIAAERMVTMAQDGPLKLSSVPHSPDIQQRISQDLVELQRELGLTTAELDMSVPESGLSKIADTVLSGWLVSRFSSL